MAQGLKNALEGLKNAVGDLASLEVQTYTGTLKVNTEGKLGDIEAFLKQATTGGTLNLVAVTKMNFDGDTINLVPDGSFPEHIQKVHDAAVKAGTETRHGLLSLFGGMIGLTTK